MTFLVCTTFAANVGGLLGLCLGCSLISIFEIIYFICLKCKLFDRSKLRSKKRDAKIGASLMPSMRMRTISGAGSIPGACKLVQK